MAAAIWMIVYDLDRTHSARYLQWFNDTHIPEKLARPGYTWAAHYQVVADDSSAASRYVALFGGTDSRVFYNPSPAQIKPGQSPETRKMMAYRANSNMLVLTEEWTFGGDTGSLESIPHISAERISLALVNAHDNDENLGAWLVQDYLVNSARAGITRKYLASTGATRHVVVHEFGEDETTGNSFVNASSSDWSAQASNYLSYPAGAPLVARRVWPGVG
ncbi:hypothetical protein N8198_00615 [Gammaproteobacteria bacterium]|nr:hypothetical protein [Gammaproteobacteria bacterium]